jgi:hypothetical protein
MLNNKSDRETSKPTKLFDYKVPVKNLNKEIESLADKIAVEETKQ